MFLAAEEDTESHTNFTRKFFSYQIHIVRIEKVAVLCMVEVSCRQNTEDYITLVIRIASNRTPCGSEPVEKGAVLSVDEISLKQNSEDNMIVLKSPTSQIHQSSRKRGKSHHHHIVLVINIAPHRIFCGSEQVEKGAVLALKGELRLMTLTCMFA